MALSRSFGRPVRWSGISNSPASEGSAAHLLKLIQHTFVVLDTLRTRHQMFAVKDDCRNAADALLCPELLFLTHLRCKPLIV